MGNIEWLFRSSKMFGDEVWGLQVEEQVPFLWTVPLGGKLPMLYFLSPCCHWVMADSYLLDEAYCGRPGCKRVWPVLHGAPRFRAGDEDRNGLMASVRALIEFWLDSVWNLDPLRLELATSAIMQITLPTPAEAGELELSTVETYGEDDALEEVTKSLVRRGDIRRTFITPEVPRA